MDLQKAHAKARTIWFAFPASILVLNAVGLFSSGGEGSLSLTMGVLGTALLAMGVLMAAVSFFMVAPVRRAYLVRASRGEEQPLERGAETDEAGRPTPAGVLMSQMFVRVAFAEAPGILAFVATTLLGLGIPTVLLLVISVIALLSALPRLDDWQAFERDLEAARTGAVPIVSG